MNTTMTPEQYADSLARQQTNTIELWDMWAPGPDIRLETCAELNRGAGNKRKRQGYESRSTAYQIVDELELQGEVIYSRHGNRSLHPHANLVPGPMQPDVISRLRGIDVVVVVRTNSESGRRLLNGDLDLEPFIPQVSVADAQQATATRVANAADVFEVVRWVVGQR